MVNGQCLFYFYASHNDLEISDEINEIIHLVHQLNKDSYLEIRLIISSHSRIFFIIGKKIELF